MATAAVMASSEQEADRERRPGYDPSAYPCFHLGLTWAPTTPKLTPEAMSTGPDTSSLLQSGVYLKLIS